MEESLGFTDQSSITLIHLTHHRKAFLNAIKKNKAKQPWRNFKKCMGGGLPSPILLFVLRSNEHNVETFIGP